MSLVVGNLFFLSLLDEELLTSASAPRQMLKYTGQVHVRDLALMLEEILYFYRPDGDMLVPLELEFVLSEYDKWVTRHAIPLAEDVLQSVRDLLASDADGGEAPGAERKVDTAKGFYRQHKLVASLHFAEVAERVAHESTQANETAVPAPPTSPAVRRTSTSSKSAELGRRSSKWSDIRLLLSRSEPGGSEKGGDRQRSTLASHSTSPRAGSHTPSIAARAEAKRRKLTALHVADASVSFYKFARWLYVVLKCVAEKRREELEYHHALQQQARSKLQLKYTCLVSIL